MDKQKIDEYINSQKLWIDQLQSSIEHMEKLKTGKVSITDERWEEIVKSHDSLGKAISNISKLTAETLE